jgi:hypothetical protein
VTDSCKHGKEPSGSIKGLRVFDYLSNYQLFKDPVPRINYLVEKKKKGYKFVFFKNKPRLTCKINSTDDRH